MIKQGLSNSDKTLMGVALAVVIGALLVLFIYNPFSDDNSDLEKIAEISMGKGDQKIVGSLNWIGTKINGDVHNGDEIFANKNQDVLVKMDDSGTINVLKGSLVKITKDIGGLNLDIQSGRIIIKSSGKQKKINIIHKGVKKKVDLSINSAIELTSTPEKINLDVKSGDAKLEGKPIEKPKPKKNIAIELKEQVEVYPEEVVQVKWRGQSEGESLKFSVDSPRGYTSKKTAASSGSFSATAPGSYKVQVMDTEGNLFEKSVNVSLKHYLKLGKIETIKKKNIVSKKVSFIDFDKRDYKFQLIDKNNKIIKEQDIKKGEYTLNNLIDNSYILRVVDKKLNIKAFDTLIEQKQLIIGSNASFNSTKSGAKVTLRWKLSKGEKKSGDFLVRVFDHAKNILLVEKKTSELSTDFDIDGFKKIRWNISSVNNEFEKSIDHIVNLIPPKPAKNLVLEGNVVMKWNKKFKCYEFKLPSNKYVKRYYVEVYAGGEKDKLVFNKWSKSGKVCWRSQKDGKFKYRYKYLDNWGRLSVFSNFGEIIFPISPLTNF